MQTLSNQSKKRIQFNLELQDFKEADQILDDLGLTMSTYLTMMVKRLIAKHGIPVELVQTEEEQRKVVSEEVRQLVSELPVAHEFKTGEEFAKWYDEEYGE